MEYMYPFDSRTAEQTGKQTNERTDRSRFGDLFIMFDVHYHCVAATCENSEYILAGLSYVIVADCPRVTIEYRN